MDAFSVRTKIMIGGGMDALAQRLHRVFLVTDKFMAESGKTNYVTDRLLRNGGRFALVHRPERLAGLMEALGQSGLEPKRLQMVQHDRDKPPSAVLVEAVRQGRPGLSVLPTLILNER